jgi:hypothetical protein
MVKKIISATLGHVYNPIQWINGDLGIHDYLPAHTDMNTYKM